MDSCNGIVCGFDKAAIGFSFASPLGASRTSRILFGLLGPGLCVLAAPLARGSSLADTVVIVANAQAPGSMEIASHYAEARHVPAANIIVLATPVGETISWKEFVATLWVPLEAELVKRGWIDAIPMDLFDDVGRRKYAVSGHHIGALVVCRGIPLRIDNDPTLYKEAPPYTDHPQFRTNQGAVDSELSLLAQNDYPINASIPNPLYGNVHPTDYARAQVVKVSRLDGPTVAEATHLVDLAIEAERTGLLGRAYVDIAGPHENGNRWLETTASLINSTGLDLSITRGTATMPVTARIDAPALYFGWYAPNLNGPFALPGFRFPPGAIAVHIHSYSAQTLRSDSEGWCGPLIARGATATLGNVFEPYLEYLHRPDYFMEALARGYTLVDAAYYALPVLSWQAIVIGDPLYRPFPGGAATAAQVRAPSASPLESYAVIRNMNLLDAAGRHSEAIAAGKTGMKASPNLALALALGVDLIAARNAEEADWTVKAAADNADASVGTWELLHEAAQFLSATGRSAEAIDVYRRLFDIDAVPAPARALWSAEARKVALESGDAAQAAEWQALADQTLEKPAARGSP